MPVKIDKVSTTLTYIGSTSGGSNTSDAVWQILRITTSGDDTDIESPINAKDKKGGIWDDRTTYTYG